MKRKIIIPLILVVSLTMACGSKADDTETVTNQTVEAADQQEPEEETIADEAETIMEEPDETESAGSGNIADDEQKEEADSENYETLEEYYMAHQSELDDMVSSMSEDDLSVSAEVNDNNYTVIFKILDSSIIVDGIAEAFEEALENRADAFKAYAASFDEELGFEAGTCTATIRYIDPDDNVLAEKTFRND